MDPCLPTLLHHNTQPHSLLLLLLAPRSRPRRCGRRGDGRISPPNPPIPTRPPPGADPPRPAVGGGGAGLAGAVAAAAAAVVRVYVCMSVGGMDGGWNALPLPCLTEPDDTQTTHTQAREQRPAPLPAAGAPYSPRRQRPPGVGAGAEVGAGGGLGLCRGVGGWVGGYILPLCICVPVCKGGIFSTQPIRFITYNNRNGLRHPPALQTPRPLLLRHPRDPGP